MKKDIVYYNKTLSCVSIPMSFKYKLFNGNRFYYNRRVNRYTKEIKDRDYGTICEININDDCKFSIWYFTRNQFGELVYENKEIEGAVNAYRFLKENYYIAG